MRFERNLSDNPSRIPTFDIDFDLVSPGGRIICPLDGRTWLKEEDLVHCIDKERFARGTITRFMEDDRVVITLSS